MPTSQNVISGHAINMRALRQEEIDQYSLEDIPAELLPACVAVYGEDLAECLAAVVYIGPEPRTLYSDADGEGTPVEDPDALAVAVATLFAALV